MIQRQHRFIIVIVENPRAQALRVVIKLESKGMTMETAYWFVKDVGYVKQTVTAPGLAVTLELEKREKKKGGIEMNSG